MLFLKGSPFTAESSIYNLSPTNGRLLVNEIMEIIWMICLLGAVLNRVRRFYPLTQRGRKKTLDEYDASRTLLGYCVSYPPGVVLVNELCTVIRDRDPLVDAYILGILASSDLIGAPVNLLVADHGPTLSCGFSFEIVVGALGCEPANGWSVWLLRSSYSCVASVS